jgi:hypothetical protein
MPRRVILLRRTERGLMTFWIFRYLLIGFCIVQQEKNRHIHSFKNHVIIIKPNHTTWRSRACTIKEKGIEHDRLRQIVSWSYKTDSSKLEHLLYPF